MKWNIRIGNFLGIDVFLHTTFLVMILWIGLSSWFQGNNITTALTGVGYILALFGSVVLHEYGHALTARKFGVKTKNITLYPIGGVANLERIPDKPKQELLVALAGPAVNLIISIMILVWLLLTSSLQPLTVTGIMEGSYLQRLMIANLALLGFNLIPAFPMDGGRVLRALLAMRLEYTVATQIAASIGQVLAFVFGFIGLFSNPFLVFIAFFVWIGAQNEAKMVRMNSALEGIPVSRAMLTNFKTLSPFDPLSRAIDHMLNSDQKQFPVIEDGQIVGILSESGLLQGLRKDGEETQVADVMQKSFKTADSHEMLEIAFNRLRECTCHTMPILHNGLLVGLVTMDNIGEFIRIQSVLNLSKGFSKG
ncbi:site-2 protease family protein [bacterium]|nr:site-2 protease family protein [bacterium]